MAQGHRWVPLVLMVGISEGAVLELKGAGSSIEMGGARLTASCEKSPAAIIFPQSVSTAGTIVGHLLDVATSCTNAALEIPCVELSILAPRPPLFVCTLSGASGSLSLPPNHAKLEEARSTQGELLALEAYVECPLASVSANALLNLVAPNSNPALTLNATVSFIGRSPAVKLGGGQVQVTVPLAAPPPTMPTPPVATPPTPESPAVLTWKEESVLHAGYLCKGSNGGDLGCNLSGDNCNVCSTSTVTNMNGHYGEVSCDIAVCGAYCDADPNCVAVAKNAPFDSLCRICTAADVTARSSHGQWNIYHKS